MVTRYRRINFRERQKTNWEVIFWAVIGSILLLGVMWTDDANAADESLKKAILQCESSNRHYDFPPFEKRVRYGDDGVSRGIAQFRKETFYEQAAEAKRNKLWPFGKPRWFNEKQQLWLLNYMLDKGMGRRWTCYRKLTEGKKWTNPK